MITIVLIISLTQTKEEKVGVSLVNLDNVTIFAEKRWLFGHYLCKMYLEL